MTAAKIVRKFSLSGSRLAVVVLAAGLAACTQDAEQVGYFKSEDNHRVMAYWREEPMDADAAREFLAGRMRTEGRQLTAVMYTGDTPHPGHDELSAAPDLPAALRVVGEDFPGWDYRVQINPAGEVTFRTGAGA